MRRHGAPTLESPEAVTVLNDGKHLEALVAFVEKALLPQGYEVKTNERIYNDDGVQIAELDVEIRGKIGSTSFAWLIECRDRPGDGAAPGSWIEQLVGRRTRFGFNKVTAVSTTGFSVGAIEFARSQAIELREVKSLTLDDFKDWLSMRNVRSIESRTVLQNATVIIDESESDERKQVLCDSMAGVPISAAFLKRSKDGQTGTLADAFGAAVRSEGMLFDDVVPNGPSKEIELTVRYENDEDHFVVETRIGPIRVKSIVFEGELCVKETLLPLWMTTEYQNLETGKPISQTATFLPQELLGTKLSMELHRIETGEIHIGFRRVEDGG